MVQVSVEVLQIQSTGRESSFVLSWVISWVISWVMSEGRFWSRLSSIVRAEIVSEIFEKVWVRGCVVILSMVFLISVELKQNLSGSFLQLSAHRNHRGPHEKLSVCCWQGITLIYFTFIAFSCCAARITLLVTLSAGITLSNQGVVHPDSRWCG